MSYYKCASDRKTQFIFIRGITCFSYFLSHHIPPQAAPVCCEYKCQNTQYAVKTLNFSEAPVRSESYYWQNLTFYWLWLMESGLRRWFQFHWPHVQSCMRCKYWISLWCRWHIIAPQHVSTAILPLVKLLCSALLEMLNWFWYFVLIQIIFATLAMFGPQPVTNLSLPA